MKYILLLLKNSILAGNVVLSLKFSKYVFHAYQERKVSIFGI